ncbi:hypothetical protein ACJIZ3_024452 [Penstemon smallii]|uniref:Arf-GAP domain-containing protein n=1 Tax=Penstemon smallii TaxID=265156 RepID=A0ABD3TT72_9LAMI
MANRLKEDEKNERIIRNLLKIPENRRCINCNSLGPQYVCTNFSTFVCTNCSGIHREFTHRVKSISMAKFTMQEVSALQGGGNASAREIYLKEWDPQRNSLPDGSNVERLRNFIKHVYVDRRYTGEKNLEKPLRAKMGEHNDYNRSPPYEDFDRRKSDRPSPGGRSPGYDQEISQNGDYKRSEVVNDWRREDRFGNGRRSEGGSSDGGGSKVEGRSPDRDSDMSSPPMVRPVREILGDSVSPLRVIEPPKATRVKSMDSSTHTQRTASSSSLASSDGNLSEVKVEASFIDFDSDPVTTSTTVSQTQAVTDASSVQQLAALSGDNWANFDSVPQVKVVNTAASNSLESVLLDLSIPAPVSGPSSSMSIPPFLSSSGSSGSSLAGGQWPIAGSPSDMQWNQIVAPNANGPPRTSVEQVGQVGAKVATDNSFGFATEPSSEAKSSGRKELPEDIFAMNYSYAPPPVSGWYSGSPYVAPGVPMPYNMPVAAPNLQPVSRSTNPFDFSNESSSVQASTFPSMQGALPTMGTGLIRTSSLGMSPSHTLPSYASPSPYLGQDIAGNTAPRPQGPSGISFEEPAFTSLNPNHQLTGIHSSNFTSMGGNPFG